MKHLVLSILILAVFTGSRTLGTQFGHNGFFCEYTAAGQYITLFFEGYCPSTVEL